MLFRSLHLWRADSSPAIESAGHPGPGIRPVSYTHLVSVPTRAGSVTPESSAGFRTALSRMAMAFSVMSELVTLLSLIHILQVKQAEAKKRAEVAQKVQEAKTLEEAYQAEKEAELKRAERERATDVYKRQTQAITLAGRAQAVNTTPPFMASVKWKMDKKRSGFHRCV